eukprot:TRINITY_DN10087_c0_g1_i1.p1 TRINITY_DN10087_c0_g1~~TRINITY_DN10087_c0_g1_i1.p1  ORF type:complete len:481 (-),score=100.70 TRINITY_DN10087_c0_g1_i1:76-1467(-)
MTQNQMTSHSGEPLSEYSFAEISSNHGHGSVVAVTSTLPNYDAQLNKLSEEVKKNSNQIVGLFSEVADLKKQMANSFTTLRNDLISQIQTTTENFAEVIRRELKQEVSAIIETITTDTSGLAKIIVDCHRTISGHLQDTDKEIADVKQEVQTEVLKAKKEILEAVCVSDEVTVKVKEQLFILASACTQNNQEIKSFLITQKEQEAKMTELLHNVQVAKDQIILSNQEIEKTRKDITEAFQKNSESQTSGIPPKNHYDGHTTTQRNQYEHPSSTPSSYPSKDSAYDRQLAVTRKNSSSQPEKSSYLPGWMKPDKSKKNCTIYSFRYQFAGFPNFETKLASMMNDKSNELRVSVKPISEMGKDNTDDKLIMVSMFSSGQRLDGGTIHSAMNSIQKSGIPVILNVFRMGEKADKINMDESVLAAENIKAWTSFAYQGATVQAHTFARNDMNNESVYNLCQYFLGRN